MRNFYSQEELKEQIKGLKLMLSHGRRHTGDDD